MDVWQSEYYTVLSVTLSDTLVMPSAGPLLDEVFLKINGRLHYLWRAVDQDGDVLDILVQRHRDRKAAKKFFRKLLKGLRYFPRVVITDKLRSYSAAIAETLPSVEHCQNKAEQPFREFTSAD
jgi:putative transposase